MVDAESALIKKNYERFKDTFNAFITKMMSDWGFSLRQEAFYDPYDYINTLLEKPGPSDNVDDIAAKLCDGLFESATVEEFTESVKANLQRLTYKSKTKQSNMFILMNPVSYADMHYLKMHNDVLFLFTADCYLEEAVIRIALQTIIESSTIRFVGTDEAIDVQLPVLKLIDPSKLYILSWRPNFVKDKIVDPFENLKGLNVPDRLIYYTNYNLPSKMRIQYNNEADTLKLNWSLLSLDLLLNKLKLIQFIEKTPSKYSNLVFVGINFDLATTQTILDAKLANDSFPLSFSDYDIMYPRSHGSIDIYYGKLSASLEYHGFQNGAKYIEACKTIMQQTSLPEFNNGKKFLSINNIKDYDIYLERSKMSEIITKLINEPGFKAELESKFEGLTLSFPKTLFFNQLDYDIVI